MAYQPASWNDIEIDGHQGYYYEPTERNEHGYVLIYLHGVHQGQLHDKPTFMAQIEKHGLPVVCPVTKRSWWTDKICAEFDQTRSAERYVIDSVLPYIEQNFDAKSPKIGLLGTSMGGQGALRFAYKYPNLFPVVAAISPAIDYQLRFDEGDETIPLMYPDQEAARQDTATLHIHPLNWPRNQWFCCDPDDYRWHNAADRLRMKLYSLGVPHECDLETSGGGHGFDYYSKMAEPAITFIAERLDQERRRVV